MLNSGLNWKCLMNSSSILEIEVIKVTFSSKVNMLSPPSPITFQVLSLQGWNHTSESSFCVSYQSQASHRPGQPADPQSCSGPQRLAPCLTPDHTAPPGTSAGKDRVDPLKWSYWEVSWPSSLFLPLSLPLEWPTYRWSTKLLLLIKTKLKLSQVICFL